MRAIHIPASITEPITLVDVAGCLRVADAIEATYAERVRIGDFTVTPPQVWTDGGVTVVMAVDEDGVEKGLMLNLRASLLYGFRVHRGTVSGAVVILGEHHVGEPDFGVDWTDLPEQYANVQFWERVTA